MSLISPGWGGGGFQWQVRKWKILKTDFDKKLSCKVSLEISKVVISILFDQEA